MSYCKEDGKDRIIFATEEDLSQPSKALINTKDDDGPPGLILPNGDLNWDCPCLGGMAKGPCGVEFREAFSCFHYSTAEPKGSDCYDRFMKMNECMSEFPAVYPPPPSKSTDLDDSMPLPSDEAASESLGLIDVLPSSSEDDQSEGIESKS